MADAPPERGRTQRARVACLDWARALGCVVIVWLHVFVSLENAVGYWGLGPARDLAEALACVALARWAVPVFLMVTGVLLLDPARPLGWGDVWRYVRRMLFVLATFGLAFCLIESVYVRRALDLAVVSEAVRNLLTGNSWGHLWYVYALLLLYALTPALRVVTARLGRRGLGLALCCAYVVLLAVPTALHLRGIDLALPLNLQAAAFYYVLGWYAWRWLDVGEGVPAWLVAAGVASLVAMGASVLHGHGELVLPEHCLVAPYGLLAFALLRRYATRPVDEVPAIALLADHSFGIYVLHPLFIHAVNHLVDPLAVPAGLYEVGTFALALTGSVVATGLLRRIPAFARHV